MPISKKRAPHISAENLERVLAQVYDDINEVIDSVNQESSTEEKKGFEGKSGDMRVSRDPTDKKYYLEMIYFLELQGILELYQLQIIF